MSILKILLILSNMFIDSHAHIDGPEFDADRDQIIERARAAGVSVILNVGTGDRTAARSSVLSRWARSTSQFTRQSAHILTMLVFTTTKLKRRLNRSLQANVC